MLQHVTFPIPTGLADECAAFWRLLGFAETEPPPSLAARARWLEYGPTQVHLLYDEEPRPRAGHVAVVLDDYEATLDALRAAGHAPEPRTEHWGAPRAYVHDPVGNLVELMAAPPP